LFPLSAGHASLGHTHWISITLCDGDRQRLDAIVASDVLGTAQQLARHSQELRQEIENVLASVKAA
jgi:hypothetical protein